MYHQKNELGNHWRNRFGLCGQGNGKGMLPDELLWLSRHIYTTFTQFDVPDYFFGSLREDVPHRDKLVKMTKIKVCKSSCIFRNMYGGPPNDPPMPPKCQTCNNNDLSCFKNGIYEVIHPPSWISHLDPCIDPCKSNIHRWWCYNINCWMKK